MSWLILTGRYAVLLFPCGPGICVLQFLAKGTSILPHRFGLAIESVAISYVWGWFNVQTDGLDTLG
ncbi:uncharacterized protein BO97DRAFT_401962 [Aspergillus homomorphus CBS 101889]|uniref:Uncharacterized protein n=1 Tax=Aspergillus homomorphus (strain CBS 101889) TaxID=1450537 RepID=A0A395IB83_ASPHC|nr:hypothetical protein BO97DRAFT_401962 [Aspergillus homomorphus CBS 101889]RAL17306.1 hypothetical protein BO97DRAFT_401962 [Aspergillus homomorphus CBS 101889]